MSGSNNAGVRNLRAMFENQGGSSSPEPRGRSPAGSASGANDVNRPTSKVRASFVSVEPTAREIGSNKGVSLNNAQAQRRESFSVSGESEGVQELKKAITEAKEERKRSVVVDEAVPEQAVETRESSRAPPPTRNTESEKSNLGSIMKGSDFPDPEPKTAPAVQPAATTSDNIVSTKASKATAESEKSDKVKEVSPEPADPKVAAPVAGGKAHATKDATGPKTPKVDGSKLSAKDTPRATGRASTKKPATISTARSPARGTSSTRNPLPKSPLPKTPTAPKPTSTATATKSPAPKRAVTKPAVTKEVTKPAAPKTTRAPVKSTATAGTTASAAAKTKAPIAEAKKTTTKPTSSAPPPKDSTTTSPGGFKKPKPRSPTRPVRLPSHLTAPTASSAAKHGEEAAPAGQKLARKPSTATRPAPKAAAPAAKKPVPRASLAPSTTAPKRPESRASTAGGGEGFLARMMRPTASSSSKTSEHKPASPPRRGAVKPAAKPKASEGLAAKSKKKVEEVAHKAKDVFTNGHEHEEKQEHAETAVAGAEESTAGADEPTAEPVESAAAESEESAAVDPVEPAVAEPAEPKVAELQVAEPEVAGPVEAAAAEPTETADAEPAETPVTEPEEAKAAETTVPEPEETTVPEPEETTVPEPVEPTVPEPAEAAIAEPVEPTVPESAEAAEPTVAEPAESTAVESSEPALENDVEAEPAPVETAPVEHKEIVSVAQVPAQDASPVSQPSSTAAASEMLKAEGEEAVF